MNYSEIIKWATPNKSAGNIFIRLENPIQSMVLPITASDK